MRDTFTPDQAAMVNRMLSLIQTDGKTASAAVDRDFLLQEGNDALFMIHYFPRAFWGVNGPRWEVLNREVLVFMEDNNEGMMWLPGGHGKTTTVLRWMIRVMCREPQISFIYIEKNEPTSLERSRAILQELENNERLIHDFGDFKGDQWSAKSFTIKQRPETADTPTAAFYGSGGGSALGKRCNILVVDDPVTVSNSGSEVERNNLWQWYSEAASTAPSPLPLSKWMKYLRKQFLIGTTFHQDDLYHRVKRNNPTIPHLYLMAVNDDGGTLSPRFCYHDPESLRRRVDEGDAAAEEASNNIASGKVLNLYQWKLDHGSVAFNRRYQNRIVSEDSKFQEFWFRGGTDDMAPLGGYPGCLDERTTLKQEFDGFKYVTGVDPAAGGTSLLSARFACVTLGADPKNPTDIYLCDMDFGQYPLDSDNPMRKTQLGVILDHANRYNSRIALETNNIQQVYAQTLRAEAQRRGMVVTITGHWTSKGGKLDADLGIEAMIPLIENGKLHLPYAEPRDRKLVEELIDEFVYWGVHPTQDIAMAFWFAWRVLQRQLRSVKAQVFVPQVIPAYRKRGDEVDFPAQWTEQQRRRYLAGRSPLDDDEEVEVAL